MKRFGKFRSNYIKSNYTLECVEDDNGNLIRVVIPYGGRDLKLYPPLSDEPDMKTVWYGYDEIE